MPIFPPPIEAAITAYKNEFQVFKKLNRLVDCYESLMKFMAIVAIQDFYRNKDIVLENSLVDNNIKKRITNHPGLGTWVAFLEDVLQCFSKYPERIFCKELYLFYYRKFGNDPEKNPHFLRNGASQKIKELRNTLRHGATLSENDSKFQLEEYDPLLDELLKKAEFLSKISLVYIENETLPTPLRFDFVLDKGYIAPSNLANTKLIISKVHAYNSTDKSLLDLSPLLIYAECKEFTAVWDRSLNHSLRKQPCGHSKFLYFNDLKRTDQIAFLDYWQGHHSHFSDVDLIIDFNNKFIDQENRKGDWFINFIQSNIEDFVGREEQITFLDEFVKKSSKRILILLGDPGIGKTALLAKWATINDYPRHFFREGEAKWQDPLWFFENLSIQIASKYGIPWAKPSIQNVTTYQVVFKEILHKAAAKVGWKQGSLVIVMDGLDEADRYIQSSCPRTPQQEILAWLPSINDIPENVKIVLSTRRNLLKEQKLLSKYSAKVTEKYELIPMSIADVRSLLVKGYSKYEIIDHPDYIEKVANRSEGNPLYLKLLLEDLVSGAILFGDTSILPYGIQNYYEKILEEFQEKASEISERFSPNIRQEIDDLLQKNKLVENVDLESEILNLRNKSDTELRTKCLEIVVLFCLAKEPISLEQVKVIIDISPEPLDLFFRHIRPVLSEHDSGKYVIFHSGFREYIFNLHLYHSNKFNRFQGIITSTNVKLINWCRRWPTHHDNYALNYLVDHLIEIIDTTDEIYCLATNSDFLIDQKSRLQNGIQAMLHTIQTALKLSIENRKPNRIVEFLFTYLERVEALEKISPLEYLKEGSLIGASTIADIYEPKYCLLWYLLMANFLISLGRQNEAIQILTIWNEKRVQTPVMFDWEDRLFDQTIQVLIDNLLDVNTYKIFWDLTGKADSRIIRFLLTHNMISEALSLALEINDMTRQYDVFGWIAIEQVRKGQPQKALQTILSIQDGNARSKSLKEIIEAQVIRDLYIKESLLNLSEAKNLDIDSIYFLISEKWARSGDYLAAIRTAQYYLNNEPSALLDDFIENITAIYLDGRRIVSCYKVFPEITDDVWKKRAVWAVAMCQGRRNDFQGAIRTLKDYLGDNFMPFPFYRSDRKFIRLFLDSKENPNIENILPKHELNKKNWYYALLETPLIEKVEQGDLIGAIKDALLIFSQINENSEINCEEYQEYGLLRIIKNLEDFYRQSFSNEEADEVLSAFEKEYPDISALLLKSRSLFGPVSEGEKIYFSIDRENFYELATEKIFQASKQKESASKEAFENALRKIILTYAEKGDFTNAISLLGKLSLAPIRNNALHDIVMEKVKLGCLDDALNILELFEDDTSWSTYKQHGKYSTKCDIVDYFIQSSHLDEALRLTNQFGNYKKEEYRVLIRLGVRELSLGNIQKGFDYLKQAISPRLQSAIYILQIDEDNVDYEILETKGKDYFELDELIIRNNLHSFLQNILISFRDAVLDPKIGEDLECSSLRKAYFLIHLADYQRTLNFREDAQITLEYIPVFLEGHSDKYQQSHLSEWIAKIFSELGENEKAILSLERELIIDKCIVDEEISKIDEDTSQGIDKRIYESIKNDKIRRIEFLKENIAELESLVGKMRNLGKKANLTKLLSEVKTIDEEYMEYQEYPCGLENFLIWTNPTTNRERILLEIADWYHKSMVDTDTDPDMGEINKINFDIIIRIAMKWAERQEFEFSKRITRMLGNEYQRSRSLSNICFAQINAGEYDDCIVTALEILTTRQEIFPKIAERLVMANAISQFFKLLPSFASDRILVYSACGALSRIFKDQVEDITLFII